jgi:flagellar protein FlbD
MIHLTRLNNTSLTVNSELIKFVEQNPDTVITLLNGEKILVRETAEQVLHRIVEFRRRLLGGTGAWHLAVASMLPVNDTSAGDNEK